MPEMINSDDAQYALDIVKTICTQVGPGLPGTSQERERAERQSEWKRGCVLAAAGYSVAR